jgi:hypothetical protein
VTAAVQLDETVTFDFEASLEDLKELTALLGRLHGQNSEIDPAVAKASAKKAERSRELQYASHLADRVRIDVMDQFYFLKRGPEEPAQRKDS